MPTEDEGHRRAPFPNGFERWRGEITQKVSGNERRIDGLEQNHRDLEKSVLGAAAEIGGLTRDIVDARSDIQEALQLVRADREKDFEELKLALTDAVASKRAIYTDVFRYIVAPILVGLIIITLSLVITGKI